MNGERIPIAVIGGGTMAQAIVRGGFDAGVIAPSAVVVADPEGPKRELFRTWGVRAVKDAGEAAAWLVQAESPAGAGQVLLAVKPQSFAEVAAALGPGLGPARRVVVSLMAGVPTAKVRAALGDQAAVVRLMPNLPARVGKSTTAVALGAGAQEGDDRFAVELFTAIGRTVPVAEPLMDAFTAVAGSGPAYLFYLAEAMTKAAVGVGFDRDTAQWIVRSTLAGAAALMDGTDQSPELLRAAVTSKGGTTAAAVAVLDEAEVIGAFVRAIASARDRGRELAGG
ncbi:MAG: pyrroline-5-carboxylate reductase [Phycisphaerales bacterium]